MSIDLDLCYLSASTLAERIRARAISPIDVVENTIRRIEAANPVVNAYVTLDFDGARAAARAADEAVKSGARLGPLHGVPVAVKDDLAVKGLRFTCGSQLRANEIAAYDDLTVTRLKQAGAIIMGKTNEPEFGHKGTTENRLFGTTVTPWNIERTAGGSSGGSAAAVAAGMAYLALGTDIAGSVRIPASCCGIVGHKPTFGRIPRVPGYNAFVTQWYIGPLARTVADTALGLRVVAGPDDRDPFALPAMGEPELSLQGDLAGLRVTWCASPTGGPVEPQVADAGLRTVRLLESRGAKVKVREKPFPVPALESLGIIFRAVTLADAGLHTREIFDQTRPLLSETLANFVEPGLETPLIDYLFAQGEVTTFLENGALEWWRDCDILATPTIAVPPFSAKFPLGPATIAGQSIDPHLSWIFTWPLNLTGQPAASIPCGWTADKVPLGLQLIGRRSADGLVFRVAAAIEQLAPWSDRRPPV